MSNSIAVENLKTFMRNEPKPTLIEIQKQVAALANDAWACGLDQVIYYNEGSSLIFCLESQIFSIKFPLGRDNVPYAPDDGFPPTAVFIWPKEFEPVAQKNGYNNSSEFAIKHSGQFVRIDLKTQLITATVEPE
jgi:hypothetical protein